MWLFVSASVLWGIPYALIRIALQGFPPASIVLARVAIGALVLIPLAAQRGGLRGALKKWPYVVAFALVEMAGPWILLTSAEQHISSSLAGLLIGTVPFLGCRWRTCSVIKPPSNPASSGAWSWASVA